MRGGFGIMYERVQGNDMYDSGGNEPFSDNISIGNVAFSNPGLSLATGTAPVSPIPVPSINEGLMSNDYKNPTSYQYSVGVQQQLGRESVLSIAYVGNQNRHQTTSAELNLPPESDLAALTGHTDTLPYLQAVPYTGFDDINMFQNDNGYHYWWDPVTAELAEVQTLVAPFPEDDPSRAFDPASATAVLFESGGGSQRSVVEITAQEAGSKKLFSKTSAWDVLTDFSRSFAPRYEKYSYGRRVDMFRMTIPFDRAQSLLAAMLEAAPRALRHRWSALRPPSAITFVCPR